MNVSFAQRLPAELIDMIIGYVLENEGFRAKKYINKILHHCHYRNCNVDRCETRNKILLDFAQVCHSFRQRALPRIWSFIKIHGKAYRSLNNFLFYTPNRETLYLQYVESISVFILRDFDRDINNWLEADSTQPFGIKVTNKSYRAWLIKQSIYWIQRRNLKNVEFKQYSAYTKDILYESNLLLPLFFYFSKNPQRNFKISPIHHLKSFRKELEKSELPKEGDWLLKFVQNRIKERIQSQQNPQSSLIEDDSTMDRKLDEALRDDVELRKEVEKLYLNNWENEKRNDFVYNKKSPDGCVHM